MPQIIISKRRGILSTLLRPFGRRPAQLASSFDSELERGLAGFSPTDQQKIRAYLALNPGDQTFIRALTKK